MTQPTEFSKPDQFKVVLGLTGETIVVLHCTESPDAEAIAEGWRRATETVVELGDVQPITDIEVFRLSSKDCGLQMRNWLVANGASDADAAEAVRTISKSILDMMDKAVPPEGVGK